MGMQQIKNNNIFISKTHPLNHAQEANSIFIATASC